LNQFWNRRVVAAAAVSAAVLVPLGAFGAPALARSVAAASQYGHGGSSQYQYKVAICHRTHSRKHPFHVINVSSHAVKAHLRHGDTLAPCPAAAPPETGKHDKGKHHGRGQDKDDDDNGNANTTTTTTTTSTTTSGGDDHGHRGGDHGNGGDHGKGKGK
jgi:hypothetical protein